MKLSKEDRQIFILRYLANHGPKTGRDIAENLEREHNWSVDYGALYVDLAQLRNEGWVKVTGIQTKKAPAFFGGEENMNFRLFDIDREKGGKKWRDKVKELERVRERTQRGTEPGLGGLSPA